MPSDSAAAAAAAAPIVPIVASPPTSPPAKRIKTTDTTATPATTATTATIATMATPAVTPAAAFLIQKLSDDARLPTRGSADAAGYDLYAARPATIPARGRALVDTDLAMAVPAGTYGRVAPRSGLAVKHGINTGAGVIDADYRGHVRVLLFNHSDADFAVAPGDRIAQLVLERIVTPEIVAVASLDASERGAAGFGSTGGFGGAAAAAAAAAAVTAEPTATTSAPAPTPAPAA